MVSPHDLGDVGASVFVGDSSGNRCRSGAKKRAAESGGTEQFGGVQSSPRTPVRLGCAEIRRLFWQLVLVVERSARTILGWSSWRRWHQAWARYYHYRRRDGAGEKQHAPAAPAPAAVQQVDMTEVVWSRLEPLLHHCDASGTPMTTLGDGCWRRSSM